MTVDPELLPILDLVNAVEAPAPTEAIVGELRDTFAAFAATLGDGPAMADERDEHVPGPDGPLAVRRYRPTTAGDGPAPALVVLHGGGFVLGSIDSHDQLCRRLAHDAGIVVVSVGYRLAPEHRFPAAVDDATAAVVAVRERAAAWGIDADRVGVGGDSAGGNLAAVVARRWRDRGWPPLRLQVLMYPVCDLTHDTARFPSLEENGDGYLLTSATMRFFSSCYVPDPVRRTDPDASPLHAADLAGLAPAVVVVAGYDPLRDEGLAYAAALADAGVPVELQRLDGAIHLVLQLAEVTTVGRSALEALAAAVRAGLR